jgi:hypothetical protein
MDRLGTTIRDLKTRARRCRYSPYAFTEHGVAMLSSVLGSERAITAPARTL